MLNYVKPHGNPFINVSFMRRLASILAEYKTIVYCIIYLHSTQLISFLSLLFSQSRTQRYAAWDSMGSPKSDRAIRIGSLVFWVSRCLWVYLLLWAHWSLIPALSYGRCVPSPFFLLLSDLSKLKVLEILALRDILSMLDPNTELFSHNWRKQVWWYGIEAWPNALKMSVRVWLSVCRYVIVSIL